MVELEELKADRFNAPIHIELRTEGSRFPNMLLQGKPSPGIHAAVGLWFACSVFNHRSQAKLHAFPKFKI